MSNYFSEQVRIRREIARQEWRRGRASASDPNWPGLVEYFSSLSFAEFWEFEFDRWINNSATDCMQLLGTYSTPRLAVN
jgi:hypothetical protein